MNGWARETKGLVQAFGAWNEYNIDAFNWTHETPEHYVKMLEVMYKSIKKGNPDALLLGLDRQELTTLLMNVYSLRED